MNKYYDEVPFEYPKDKPVSTEDEFFGDSWSVIRKPDGKFLLQFISGELAGRLKTIEISELEFNQVKAGLLSIDELCLKYSVG